MFDDPAVGAAVQSVVAELVPLAGLMIAGVLAWIAKHWLGIKVSEKDQENLDAAMIRAVAFGAKVAKASINDPGALEAANWQPADMQIRA